MPVQPIPPGFHTLTPYFIADNASKLIEFLAAVFAAEVKHITKHTDGSVMHASLLVGDSMLMCADARAQWPAVPVNLYVYLPDVDAAYQRALKAGATSINAPSDQFYGDRMAGVKDPCGNTWWIATQVEEVSEAEMNSRREKLFGGQIKH